MKTKSGSGSVPNKHLHSRVNYLYQAAAFLDKSTQPTTEDQTNSADSTLTTETTKLGSGFSRHMVSNLRSVSLKAQMRLSPSIKHTVCKCCDTLLKEGSTLNAYVENKSRDRKKLWADVLVLECTQCGSMRRFPVGAKRQLRRPNRTDKVATAEGKPEGAKDLDAYGS